MKKVININFQGTIVPIEESSYELLKQYIESLRRHFANEEGKDEIINDIESRISELFQERLKGGSTCITDDDVNAIIKNMGRPEDFDDDDIPVKKGKASSSKKHKHDDDDDDDDVEIQDDWEKSDDDDYDPDFEEFDIPKSKTKKASGKKGKEDDDFDIDDDFKTLDLFEEGSDVEEDDDF